MAMPLNGKYNTATVFTDNIDSETISQVIELLNQPFVADSQIRIMPDCHAGNSGEHYSNVTADKIGEYVAGAIECIADEYKGG